MQQNVQRRSGRSLRGRTLYIPRMGYESARLIAATFQSLGIDSKLLPDPGPRTIELGKRHTSGDECYPQQVTLGGCLQVLEQNGVDPAKVAFLMPTSGGPCRFGQYAPFLEKVLKEIGCSDVLIFTPTCDDNYAEFSKEHGGFKRIGWRAAVAGDILRKLLLKTRPYETVKGTSDQVYAESLDDLCATLSARSDSHKEHLENLLAALERTRQRFRTIPARYDAPKPLIGMVGEIYCRLDNFANDEIIRIIERHGGEVWISDISEWIWFTDFLHQIKLKEQGNRSFWKILSEKLKNYIQRRDEHALIKIFADDFEGYEESENIEEILKHSLPYLPFYGSIGEMTLSVGRSIYLYEKGADGIVDVSPFSCMNGIVSESVYPSVSKEHDDIPIRVLYFDGTQCDWDRDIGIFIELAKSYQRRKKKRRNLPSHFYGKNESPNLQTSNQEMILSNGVAERL